MLVERYGVIVYDGMVLEEDLRLGFGASLFAAFVVWTDNARLPNTGEIPVEVVERFLSRYLSR